jgi:mannose-6-phosphate isomerase-like protein (cupin superfamily)
MNLPEELIRMNLDAENDKKGVFADVISHMTQAGYEVVEVNDERPWGGYVRFTSSQAEQFVEEFFPGLTYAEASLDHTAVELSPKILIVAPSQRLSWQYHTRRAERWRFLTKGMYIKSDTDEEGEQLTMNPGEVVQFQKGERHRLVGLQDSYSLVAEIWQHLDQETPSNEEDIVRIADDYNR